MKFCKENLLLGSPVSFCTPHPILCG